MFRIVVSLGLRIFFHGLGLRVCPTPLKLGICLSHSRVPILIQGILLI